jgi:hypothetical protein
VCLGFSKIVISQEELVLLTLKSSTPEFKNEPNNSLIVDEGIIKVESFFKKSLIHSLNLLILKKYDSSFFLVNLCPTLQ